MTALNACITVGYVAGAAVKGIPLEKVEIETSARSTYAGSSAWTPRCARVRDDPVRRPDQGPGNAEQFQEIHETVMKTSPTTSTSRAP